jgi:hypothetical protein
LAKNEQRPGFLPGWRKGTYLILGFNLFMLAWIVIAASSGSVSSGDATNCGSLSRSDCNTAQGIGTSIAMMLLIPLWAMGDVILSVAWFVTNGKKGRTAQSAATPSRRDSWPASPVAIMVISRVQAEGSPTFTNFSCLAEA